MVLSEANDRVALDLKTLFPFELDGFQQQAITALDRNQSIVVCAPTGSGKTIIGEYAIHRAIARQKRVFYTTPLKALSNQKFRDFQLLFDPENVGLITGDVSINAQGAIVVMTAEIFRNMLYETPVGEVGTSLESVDAVVLDECHYISDSGRGTVWEESIIYCPANIQLIALSATIGNPEELADWIEQVRQEHAREEHTDIPHCELICSDHRPVPLQFHFSNKRGLWPLLNAKGQLHPKLNEEREFNKYKKKKHRKHKEDCPTTRDTVLQLKAKQMLPAIYCIFSRRGCDRAVAQFDELTLVNETEALALKGKLLPFLLEDNAELQEKLLTDFAHQFPKLHHLLLQWLSAPTETAAQLLTYLVQQPEQTEALFAYLAEESPVVRSGQLEPLLRGIAAHHAGILPRWKELVETLFEAGLVKVVFATATLAAGINMPARTTVISALSKRGDHGHRLLTPTEFLQIAGRAGRRGMDTVGHVVTVDSPFEGAKEAAHLSTANVEPLTSCFTPSYGMVLNLLQKHSLEEVKALLKQSFAEYLATRRLQPQKNEISEIQSTLDELNRELEEISPEDFASYEKMRERLKEERRLLSILKQQATIRQRTEMKRRLKRLTPGQVITLKSERVRLEESLFAVVVARQNSAEGNTYLCLGANNRWYGAIATDIAQAHDHQIPEATLAELTLPDWQTARRGRWWRGDEQTEAITTQLTPVAISPDSPPEVLAQVERVQEVKGKLAVHPLKLASNAGYLLQQHRLRVEQERLLRRRRRKLEQQRSKSSYYWDEFLNLIAVLQAFQALDDLTPTPLGEIAACIRSENELWLGLAFYSGELDFLSPPQLAAAVSALITETPRPDSSSDFAASPEVLQVLGIWSHHRRQPGLTLTLWEIRQQLEQCQSDNDVELPIWLEGTFIGAIEHWALGVSWEEFCDRTSFDEGDAIRLLRRTIDVLTQIPQIPHLSPSLVETARTAITQLKRYPI